MADEVILSGSAGADTIFVNTIESPSVVVINESDPSGVIEGLYIPGPHGPQSTVPGPQGESGQAGTYVLVKDMANATSYTPTAVDAGCLVTFNDAATITLPSDAVSNIVNGKTMDFVSYGGVLTFVESGTTIRKPDTLMTRKANSIVTAIKVSSNTWLLAGDLV